MTVHADGVVNISAEKLRVVQRDSEALVIANKENYIEENAEKN
jgi:hypothetical protein